MFRFIWTLSVRTRNFLHRYTICSDLVADGGPGWLHLVALWGCWNALKFIVMGPISVVLLVRVRIREAMIRRDQRRGARADERESLVLA